MVKLKFTSLLLFLVYGSDLCWGFATVKDVQDIFENIIDNRTNRHRPVQNQSQPIIVSISLELISLVDVDEVRQTLSTNVLLTLTWQDEIRKWTPSTYGDLTNISPDPLDIWRPRLFVSNTVAERDMFKDDYAPLTLFYNGTTIWQPGGILHTSCPMKLARYPFDRHSCKIAFTTGESPEEIRFETEHKNISLENYETNGEWNLSTTSIDVDIVKLNRESMPRLSFNFQLQRKVSFAILCILMPVIVISSLPALVFITPVDSGERVTFSITVFLSLTFSTEQMSGNFPKNSESLPWLVIYLACLLMYSSLAVCVNLVVLLKQNKQEHEAKTQEAEKTTSNDSHGELDRTKSFVSISAKYDLDLPLCSLGTAQSRQEKPLKFCVNPQKFTVDKHEKDSSKLPIRKNPGRFGSMFKKKESDTSFVDNVLKGKKCKKFNCKFPSVVNQMNPNDIVLFIIFSCMWFILAVVFIILQVGDY